MQRGLAMSLQRAPIGEGLPVTAHAHPPPVLEVHQPPPPLLVRLILIVGIFSALGLPGPALVPTPLRPSSGRVRVGPEGCTHDAYPRRK